MGCFAVAAARDFVVGQTVGSSGATEIRMKVLFNPSRCEKF